MKRYDELKKTLQEKVLEKIDYSRELTDDEVKEVIADTVLQAGREGRFKLAEKERLGKEIFYALRRFDLLQDYIEDASVTEIMVNGTEGIFIERAGRLIRLEEQFTCREKLEDIVQQMVARCNRSVNEASPIVDARLENGSRVHIVLPPVALNGPIITIRRFPDEPYTMRDLLNFGALSEETAEWLSRLVRAKYNIFISGGTGSGKTTFLNALSGYIPEDERIITIEDSAELKILNVQNLVRLETRNAGVEGCREISVRDLIRAALRMRPDRIILGEVRGAEAVDLLQCLNTGHDGSLSTGHANSAPDMLSRLETMVLSGMDIPLQAVRKQIASAVDIIIHLGRLRDRSRKVLEIAEVTGCSRGEVETTPLYRFIEQGEENGRIIGSWQKRGDLADTRKLRASGLEG